MRIVAYPVMMALRRVAFSSSDLRKMEDEKSSGSDVVSDDNSCRRFDSHLPTYSRNGYNLKTYHAQTSR